MFLHLHGAQLHPEDLISFLDAQVGRVMAALEASPCATNTIVVFAADHGEYAVAHGMLIEKWHGAYEEMMHVPLILRLPGEARGRVIEDQVGLIDLTPTTVIAYRPPAQSGNSEPGTSETRLSPS